MNEVSASSTTRFTTCAFGIAPNNGPTKQQQQNCLAGYNNSTAGKVVQFFSLYNLATNFKSAWPDWTVVPAAKLAAVKLINTASQAFGNTEFLSIAGAQSTTVLEYLTRWRMRRAGDKLVNSSDPVSSIAFSLGYESESAFGFAFKRQMGCSPRQYCYTRRSTGKLDGLPRSR
jgi:hypothetical protein